MTYQSAPALLLATALCLHPFRAFAQEPTPTQPAQTTSQITEPTQPTVPPDTLPKVEVTDAERAAVVITSYDLDLHLVPAEAREDVHATLLLRNTSAAPLPRIPLQISGSLRWQTIASAGDHGLAALPFTQSPIGTDADHTGFAQEAILTPAHPLAPGASLTVSVFYAGEIRQSLARLTLLGVDPERATATEWDSITPTSDTSSTALRGFGNVLWYPVASPAVSLGEGNQLFALTARQRRANASTPMRLRLTVEYVGDPPDSAIFDGQLQPLTRLPDADTTLVEETHGLATAEFPFAPIGFRTPSLFLTAQHAFATPDQLLSLVTPSPETAEPYATAAQALQPVLSSWLGPTPIAPLLLLDHPGAPFEDSAFIAARLVPTADPKVVAPQLVAALTHAWFKASAPSSVWLDQGLADFMSLLWTENTQGSGAAIAALEHSSTLLALAEPDLSATPTPAGEPLTSASSDVYIHLKSASVLWQLRAILGDTGFREGLIAFRHSLTLNPTLDRDPKAFQHALERATSQPQDKDLSWFFDDWVYRDRGLPDLSITRVNARKDTTNKGQLDGYLVATEVRNDGDAIAEVPVTVRSSTASLAEHLRISPHASATVRIFFQGTPTAVEVNDGTVPELRASLHSAPIVTP